jgi:hypothetical protein
VILTVLALRTHVDHLVKIGELCYGNCERRALALNAVVSVFIFLVLARHGAIHLSPEFTMNQPIDTAAVRLTQLAHGGG